MQIRPVAPHEHEAFRATAARAGISSPSIQFYMTHAQNTAYVAEEKGEIIGTGVAIRHGGSTGWLAAIAVSPEHQGRGLGRALVEWGEEALRRRGAQSVVLLSSVRGRPMYEKMGYQTGISYHSFNGTGDDRLPMPAGVRPLLPSDWQEVRALDQEATGEERSWALQALPGGFVVGELGRIRGFCLPAPWGGGPAMARDGETGRRLIDLARRVRGPEPLVLRTSSANPEAMAYLEGIGFTPRSVTTYMVKGAWPSPYRPDRIWGMFSFGMG